jgi:Cupredoxin-like domain
MGVSQPSFSRIRSALPGILSCGLALAAILGSVPARADEPTFNLTIKNHTFEPTQIEVPAGVKIKLVVKNADTTPEEFESADLRREKVIPGGQQAIIFIGPLRAGTYEFFGDFNPNTARGHIVAK